jgi:hypothetical protein
LEGDEAKPIRAIKALERRRAAAAEATFRVEEDNEWNA